MFGLTFSLVTYSFFTFYTFNSEKAILQRPSIIIELLIVHILIVQAFQMFTFTYCSEMNKARDVSFLYMYTWIKSLSQIMKLIDSN